MNIILLVLVQCRLTKVVTFTDLAFVSEPLELFELFQLDQFVLVSLCYIDLEIANINEIFRVCFLLNSGETPNRSLFDD
jgi:hypothetical protein